MVYPVKSANMTRARGKGLIYKERYVLFQLSATYFTCTETNMYCANIWWRKIPVPIFSDSGFYIFIHLFMYLDGKKIFPMK